MIFASLQSGLAQVRANKRLLWVYYLSNLFFGLLLALPLRFVLADFIGNSEMGERLAGPLDMDFLFEFIKQNRASVSALTGLLFVGPAGYWLGNLFLSGGAFATFAQNEKYSAAFFWSHAAKYFGRFTRLALWSIPLLGVLFCVQYLETGIRLLIFGKDAYQNLSYWGGWIRTALLGLSFGVFAMILDYARLHTVRQDENKMRISLWEGIKFTSRNFIPTGSLALLIFVFGGAALLLYNLAANSLSAPNGLIVFLLFVWQQAYMFVRTILRLVLYASETHLYQNLAAQAAATEHPQHTGDWGTQGFSLATE